MRVPVYRFELFDLAARTWRRQVPFATMAHIEALGGAAVLGSKRFVDEHELSPKGVWTGTGPSRG